MKIRNLLILVACAALIGGCAAVVPKELSSAREAYQRASSGPAMQIAPAQLHVAYLALARAEQSFKSDPESYQTRDLAYVATRKAELAEATASIAIEQKSQAQSQVDFQATQSHIIDRTQTALAASERSGAISEELLSGEQDARAAAERRAAESQAALARLAAVRQEPRGMVITLSGSVLFASGKSTLLPDARARLDQVAAVLLTTPENRLIIEGHTDSQGADDYNQDLSQRRANSIRDYLVVKGYQTGRIQSNGLGEGHPIADNTNAEGRANNRRVEIIIVSNTSAGR